MSKQITETNIFNALSEHFSVDDMQLLWFFLKGTHHNLPDWENTKANTKNITIRNMITECKHREILDKLIDAIKKERPNAFQLKENLFVNREKQQQEVKDCLKKNMMVVLCGHRSIGKSAFTKHMHGIFSRDKNLMTVEIDFGDLKPSIKEICDKIYDNLGIENSDIDFFSKKIFNKMFLEEKRLVVIFYLSQLNDEIVNWLCDSFYDLTVKSNSKNIEGKFCFLIEAKSDRPLRKKWKVPTNNNTKTIRLSILDKKDIKDFVNNRVPPEHATLDFIEKLHMLTSGHPRLLEPVTDYMLTNLGTLDLANNQTLCEIFQCALENPGILGYIFPEASNDVDAEVIGFVKEISVFRFYDDLVVGLFLKDDLQPNASAVFSKYQNFDIQQCLVALDILDSNKKFDDAIRNVCLIKNKLNSIEYKLMNENAIKAYIESTRQNCVNSLRNKDKKQTTFRRIKRYIIEILFHSQEIKDVKWVKTTQVLFLNEIIPQKDELSDSCRETIEKMYCYLTDINAIPDLEKAIHAFENLSVEMPD